METSMTYKQSISGCAAVTCSARNTLSVEKTCGGPCVATGTIIDRLHDYETLGSPEYFKELIWKKVNPYLKKDKPALPEIDRVIFNNPATIVFWKDDTKTVVKANNGEPYDPEKGLAMAMVKKVSGNKGNYYNTIRKELDKIPYDISEVAHIERLENALGCLNQCERNVNDAYNTLRVTLQCKNVTKADLIKAMQSAVGDLGELIDEGGPLD